MSGNARTTRRGFLSFRFESASDRTPTHSRPAIILTHQCLAHLGTFCSVCKEHCPEPGAIVVDRGKPTIVADRCTGCAVCADVCPAPLGGAIAVMRALRTQR